MSFRMQRLQHQFMQEISYVILREIKDPRVQNAFITIVDIKISPDLSEAKVFVSVMQEEPLKVVEGLNHSAGFIRSVLGKKMHLKRIPHMEFFIDATMDKGDRISRLLKNMDDKRMHG